MKFFKEQYDIQAVVYSDSPSVKQVCMSMGILVEPIPEFNLYGLPIIKSLFLSAKKHFDATHYVFINSDILLDPKVLLVSEEIQKWVPSPVSF